MKFVKVCLPVFFAVLMFSSSTSIAQSDTSVAEIVAALEQSRVFVEPGTEQTNSDTQGILAERLQRDDQLLVVMLAGGETTMSESELLQLAREIDEAMGGGNIVAVSSGEEVVAFANILPSGEAAELMTRAESVSTNTPEVMSTFIRNVHNYTIRNPEAITEVPTQNQQATDDASALVYFGAAGLTTVIVVFVAIALRHRRRSYYSDPNNIRLKESPDAVIGKLETIMSYQKQIRDSRVVDLIREICIDTEAYFQRNTRRGEPLRNDSDVFVRHLDAVINVLDRYVDIQNNQRYYDEPNKHMQRGSTALEGFAQYVLENCKRGSRDSLTNYRVDTKILDAQRYS